MFLPKQVYQNRKTITGNSLSELPNPIGGVITIPTLTNLLIPSDLDLQGNRLFFEEDCALLGNSSETSFLYSTLGDNVPLITSVGSLPIQNIALEVLPASVGNVPYIFELDGIAEIGAALDWFGVNCLNSKIGNIKNYSNFVATLCAFIETKGGFVFDGTFDSIVFENCIFRGSTSIGTHLTIPNTATINRRIRLEKTPFIVLAGSIGIDVSTSATIPIEGYILNKINFSGAGTYIQGIQSNANKAVVTECRGIANSGEISEYYMNNNATSTPITVVNTFQKVLGTTSSGVNVQRFTNTNNRATYTGAITSFFKVGAILSATSGNNQLIIARIAKNGVTIASSESQSTTSGVGRSENLKCQTIVQLATNDYIEVFVTNGSATTAVTVSELNVIVENLS